MVWCKHDAVARGDRLLQPIDSLAFHAFDCGGAAEVSGQNWPEEMPPEFSPFRRHEAIGFRDDDVLHASGKAAADMREVKGWEASMDHMRVRVAIALSRKRRNLDLFSTAP